MLEKLFAVHLACIEFKPGHLERRQALKPVFISVCKIIDRKKNTIQTALHFLHDIFANYMHI